MSDEFYIGEAIKLLDAGAPYLKGDKSVIITLRYPVSVCQADVEAARWIKSSAEMISAQDPQQTTDKEMAELFIEIAEKILLRTARGETYAETMNAKDIKVLHDKIFWLSNLIAEMSAVEAIEARKKEAKRE